MFSCSDSFICGPLASIFSFFYLSAFPISSDLFLLAHPFVFFFSAFPFRSMTTQTLGIFEGRAAALIFLSFLSEVSR
jgi:hypothetical protein